MSENVDQQEKLEALRASAFENLSKAVDKFPKPLKPLFRVTLERTQAFPLDHTPNPGMFDPRFYLAELAQMDVDDIIKLLRTCAFTLMPGAYFSLQMNLDQREDEDAPRLVDLIRENEHLSHGNIIYMSFHGQVMFQMAFRGFDD